MSDQAVQPIWFQTAAPCPAPLTLSGTVDVEVAIIGAGVAGLSTALHLAERGVNVAVVEAESPGAGTTQASSGLIVPDFVSHTPKSVNEKLGETIGRRMSKLVGSSAATTFGLIERHRLSCSARREGFLIPSHSAPAAAKLGTRAQEWRALGFQVGSVSALETSRLTGTEFYRTGIRYEDGGTVNPLSLARELVRKTVELGGAVFANSPVRQAKRVNGRWQIATEGGRISAHRAVFAANGANAALHPAMRATTLPFTICEFATEPLPEALRTEILPEGGCFTDKQPNLFTARYDDEGRLVSAFGDFLKEHDLDNLKRVAEARVWHYFPTLKTIAVERVWRGTARINPSILPQLYDLGDNAIAIQACNGRGLAINMALGSEVSEYLASNRDQAALSLPLSRPHPIRGYAIAQHGPALAMMLARLKNP